MAFPRGVRILNIYDRAGINFAYWARARQQCAVYFLRRVKEGMVFDYLRELEWNRDDLALQQAALSQQAHDFLKHPVKHALGQPLTNRRH
ncbi:MAG: hypothetical protein U0903_18855 [Planctomycetales bacterium]